jgi:hypothetical protein
LNTCICQVGYTGFTCSSTLSYKAYNNDNLLCNPSCQNGGSCSCKIGYYGDYCQFLLLIGILKFFFIIVFIIFFGKLLWYIVNGLTMFNFIRIFMNKTFKNENNIMDFNKLYGINSNGQNSQNLSLYTCREFISIHESLISNDLSIVEPLVSSSSGTTISLIPNSSSSGTTISLIPNSSSIGTTISLIPNSSGSSSFELIPNRSSDITSITN